MEGWLVSVEVPVADGVFYRCGYGYDGNGNLTSETYEGNLPGDPIQNVTTFYVYDANNHLTVTSKYAPGQDYIESVTSYDAGGRLVSQTVGTGEEAATTTYTYNYLNLPVTVTDPLGGVTEYTYNLDGTVKTMTDAADIQTSYTYDAPDRLTSKSQGNLTTSYTYDMLGNRTSVEEKKNNVLQSKSEYEYNALGWLLSETTDNTVKYYSYNKAGDRLSFQTPGIDQTYTYNALRQLTSVKQAGTTIADYTYDDMGRLAAQTLKNGDVTQYTYNKAGWITNIQTNNGENVISDIDYTYYANGDVATETNGTEVTQYTYDASNRLKTEKKNGITTTYRYDSRGNRLGMTVDGANGYTVENTFDKNNKQLASEKTMLDGSVQTTAYTYDNQGNLIKEISETLKPITEESEEGNLAIGFWEDDAKNHALAEYEYDAYNRLTHIFKGGVRADYTYTADGLRSSQTVNNSTSRWVWDGTRLVKDGDTNYYYGLSLISSSAGNYYVLNGHGDVAALTNEEGEKVRAYSYSAFGIEENPDWDDENPFRYCGEYYDKGIGAIYLRARTYDPSTGRFTTEDPAKDGLNWYVYCYNNPVNLFDPSGLDPQDKSILSREDYVKVLFLQLAFTKAEQVGNTRAMDGAAEQAAKIRQKPEYNGKYRSQWDDGTYKKTYIPHEGFDGGNGGVYVNVDILDSELDVYFASGQYISDFNTALSQYSGGNIVIEGVLIATNLVEVLMTNDERIARMDVGTAIVQVQITDYRVGQDFYGEYMLNSSNINIYRNEQVRYSIPVGGRHVN